MGMTFDNLTWDDLCDLMCGCPEDELEEGEDEGERNSDDANRQGETVS